MGGGLRKKRPDYSQAKPFGSFWPWLIVIFILSPLGLSLAWFELAKSQDASEAQIVSVFLVVYLAYPIVMAFIIPRLYRYFCQRKRNKQAITVVSQAISSDSDSRFYLYLRPFDSTNEVANAMGFDFIWRVILQVFAAVIGPLAMLVVSALQLRRWELEEHLVHAFKHQAPIIGLGKSRRERGVGRVELQDDQWQEYVARLMKQAAVIVLVPHFNEGTQWEIRHILENDYLYKTVLIDTPRVSRFTKKKFDNDEIWNELHELFCEYGYSLPPHVKQGNLVYYSKRRIPMIQDYFYLGIPEATTAFLGRCRKHYMKHTSSDPR